jgi:serine protease
MKALLPALIAGALLSNAAFAAEKNIALMVKASADTIAPASLPGYTKHKQIGDYVKIVIDAEFKDMVLHTLERNGHEVSGDVSFRRPASAKGVSAPYISAQSTTLNDPRLSDQGELTSSLNTIKDAMDERREIRRKPRVLVLDTGSVPHEDLVIAGGYSVTTEFEQEPGPDYTDSTTSGAGPSCSSGHGNQMMGVIGAEQNNGVGIAGIVDADLYMIRAVSTNCDTGEDTGSLIDLYEGLVIASGGSRAYEAPTPDVVLMSLAAESPCPTYLSDAVSELNEKGVTVVVSSGNQAGNTASYAPANCPGVVVVGAHESDGSPSSYTNVGNQVDIAVEGSRLTTDTDGYVRVEGTSLSAAAAAGVVALLKSNFPDATPEQVEWVLRGSASAYPQGVCEYGCGAGKLDAAAALALSEQIIDPGFEFVHAADESCRDTREIEALSSYVDVCNALIATVSLPYAGDVGYDIKLMKREKGTSIWQGERVTELSRHAPDAHDIEFPLLDVDFTEFDYAAVACDEEGACPFVAEINPVDINYPSNCN